MAHVVTANKLDGAASRPSSGALVAKHPGLLKDVVGRHDGAIGHAIAKEDGTEVLLIDRCCHLGDLLLLDFLLDLRFGLLLHLGFLSLGHFGLHVHNGLHRVDGVALARSLCRLGGVLGAVAHRRHALAILVLAGSSDANVANRRLELDEGMGLVVLVGRGSFAVCAEVKVMTDRTLVANASDVGGIVLVAGAQGSIAANAHVHRLSTSVRMNISQRLIDGRKAMAGVDKGSVDNAFRAVIPVWAVQALVADASDVLVTAITNSVVSLVATSSHLDGNVVWHVGTCNSRDKGMLGVVTMGILGETSLAEVEILASRAVEELGLGKF